MSLDLPISIDPVKLAVSGNSISGTIMLKDMQRLVDLVNTEYGNVNYELTFSMNEKRVVIVIGSLKSELTVTCQRCLDDMEISINNNVSIGIINEEDELEDLNEGLDPYQAEEGKISLLKLIEDEILLGLPLVPLHEEALCPATKSLQEYTATKENPFAVLKTLKQQKS